MKKRKQIIFLIFLLISIITFLSTELYISKFNYKVNNLSLELKEQSQGNEDDPYAAARFRWEMVTGGRTDIDPIQLRSSAIEKTKNEMSRDSRLEKGNAITWSSVGPGNIGGRIRAIIINPSNSNEILIASVSGGIWKTTNAGTSWSPKLDTQDPIAIGSMVLVGSSTVYAGTGEGWWNIDAVYGGGIYKSTNFGDSWTLLSSTIGGNIWNFRNVLRMGVDPSGNVYAVTKAYNEKGGVGSYTLDGGLFRSSNAGTSWTKISSSTFSTNYFNGCDVIPISSSTILFATNANGATLGGIYRTTDGGTNWTKITSGLPTNSYARIALAQDPNNSSIIYAVFEATTTGNPYFGLRGIYKSTNGGLNWTQLTSPPTIYSTGYLSYLSAQGWYDNIISINPFNSNHIYVGGVEIMKST
ncbi:MAG: hypothetical protein OQK64_04220, partial [Ignavibacteriaceae bacterium]|nr:hypothetical protein [Ignavibacteriaceae bacterium]